MKINILIIGLSRYPVSLKSTPAILTWKVRLTIKKSWTKCSKRPMLVKS